MNIANINALMGLMQSLGLQQASKHLLRKIVFKPESFTLQHKMEKDKELLSFHLYFERDSNLNAYNLMYYDASLRPALSIDEQTINSINTRELEKRMSETDWKSFFTVDAAISFNKDDKATWAKEENIEAIVADLQSLEQTEEGKVAAAVLKLKYWDEVLPADVTGIPASVRSRGEVSQKFYLFNGQAGISVDEAYRFLQNRWMEKQLLAKRKETEKEEPGTGSSKTTTKRSQAGRKTTKKALA